MKTDDIDIVHVLPGRVRLKIPKLKQDQAFGRQIERQFSSVKGIERVHVHPLTGSVVVMFDQEQMTDTDSLLALSNALSSLFPNVDLSPADVQAFMKQGADGASSPGEAFQGTSTSAQLQAFTSSFNAKIADMTGGLEIKSLLPLAFSALAIRELLVGKNLRFPSWYDFLWFSFASHHMLNNNTANEPAKEARER